MRAERRDREPLTIAAAQPRWVSYDLGVNTAHHAAAVRSAGARVVVFPELSLMGYGLDAPAVAVDDPRLAPIVDACAEAGPVALVGAPWTAARAARTSRCWPSTAAGRRWRTARCGWARRKPAGSLPAGSPARPGGGFARAAGHSAIWAPDGAVLARTGPEPGAIARATLNPGGPPG